MTTSNLIAMTGLMSSVFQYENLEEDDFRQSASFSRWFLSLPGLDVNIVDRDGNSALHHLHWDCPLDIVILLTKLASWTTINLVNNDGRTALDIIMDIFRPEDNVYSITLYLTWLGAACLVEIKLWPEGVTLQTWLDAGLAQDAQYWAVVANDVAALKTLRYRQDVTMDWPRLRELAQTFNNWEAWSYLSSLRQLSWEELERTTPALVTLPPVVLLQNGVPDHVLDIVCDQRALTTMEALRLKASKLERANKRLMAENDEMKSLLERTTAELKSTMSLPERTTSAMITD